MQRGAGGQAFRLNQQRRKRLARTHAAEHEERHGEDEAARAKEEVEWTVVDVCAAVWSDVAQQVRPSCARLASLRRRTGSSERASGVRGSFAARSECSLAAFQRV